MLPIIDSLSASRGRRSDRLPPKPAQIPRSQLRNAYRQVHRWLTARRPFIAVAAAAVVALAGSASAESPVFGPETFVGKGGLQQIEIRSFGLSGLTAPFLLRIDNGDGGKLLPVADSFIFLNGVTIVKPNDLPTNGDIFELEVDLKANNDLGIQINDARSHGFSLSILGSESPVGSPTIAILDPVPGTVTASGTIDVVAQVTGNPTLVSVNGVVAQAVDGHFVATAVPLAEGTNQLVGTAQNAIGEAASANVSVRRDTQPPLVVIETPGDGDRLIDGTISVAGTVSDIIPGATINEDDVTVTINGLVAAVDNRTFFLPALELDDGENRLVAVAVDRAGNQASTTIDVSLEPELPGVRLAIVSGDGQRGPIAGTLASPLVVRAVDPNGAPIAGRTVTFQVSRGDGLVGAVENASRRLSVLTDGLGQASLPFTLGSRTGEGFHRVRAETPGAISAVELCATAETAPPARLSVAMAAPRHGPIGQPLSEALSVIATDGGGNPVPGVEVTFAVERGGGSFEGQSSVVRPTDTDGVARAPWTLGPSEGVENNEASATFEGRLEPAAVFLASGFRIGPVEETQVSGVIQNAVGEPIVGATAVLEGTDLEALTGLDGRFVIENVVPGGHRLGIRGGTADNPGAGIFYPDIHFAVDAISGADNALEQVVVLPFLDRDNAKLVGGDQDVVLGMAGVPNFAIKVFAGSVILPDGTRGEIEMSSSQVKIDKVPMPPPQGGTPLVVGTLQPAGIRFDPPAQVIYPNAEGLAPGDVADIYAFHNDIGQFVNVGPGTVSEDGDVVTSDPGFGISRSGWHCLLRFPGPTASVANKCSSRLEWQQILPDGSLGPLETRAPVVLDTSQNSPVRAVLRLRFSPAGGSLNGIWSGGDPFVRLVGETNNGATTELTIETAGVSDEATLLSPLYTVGGPDGPAASCETEVAVGTAKLELVADRGGHLPSLEIANWQTAFDASGTVSPSFVETDRDRFVVRITDPARGGSGQITATLQTVAGAGTVVDAIEGFPLFERASPPDSGVFESAPKVLVSNAVDDAFPAGGVPDGDTDDPTIKIYSSASLTAAPSSVLLDRSLRVGYDPSTGTGPTGGAEAEITQERSVCGASGVKTVSIRPFVLRDMAGGTAVVPASEMREDLALANVAWAQCCLEAIPTGPVTVIDPPPPEPFSDTGFDHDGLPATPPFNIAGVFDFNDLDADTLHDVGEPSEGFTDTNGNGAYDHGVDLGDGFDLAAGAGPLLDIPTRDERSLFDTVADGNAQTIEAFVVNTLPPGTRGIAYIPAAPILVSNLQSINYYVVRSSGVGINAGPRDFTTAAHELGHIVTNNFHSMSNQNLMHPTPNFTDAANASKRLTASQCFAARSF